MQKEIGRRGRTRGFKNKFHIEVRDLPVSTRRSLFIWAGCLSLIGLVCFLILLVDVVDGQTHAIDAPIAAWLATSHSPALTSVMIWLAIIFGPVALPIVVLIVIVSWGFFATNFWRPLLLAGGMLTGLIAVQVLTRVIGRARPPVGQMLFGTDTTFSFPSGHVLGAADFLLLVTYLVMSRRGTPPTAVLSYFVATLLVLVASVSRIYLGYHWMTDALASMSLSLIVLGAVIAIDTYSTTRPARLKASEAGP